LFINNPEKDPKVSILFKNTRGIRQGFPLSALLFVLSVEIMASRLRNNKDIKGFHIKIDEKALNPKCLRVFSMKFHSKESKAFVKSTKIIAPSILYISKKYI
jgi:hypothetical protein